MAGRVCSIEGCGNPHNARGWCVKHYNRWLKHGDPTHGPAAPRTHCSIKGCNKSGRLTRGWCTTHYGRWLNHGDPTYERPKRKRAKGQARIQLGTYRRILALADTPDAYTLEPDAGMSVEQVRNVSCPTCGAWQTLKCLWPRQNDPGTFRALNALHPARVAKAKAYRAEGRI